MALHPSITRESLSPFSGSTKRDRVLLAVSVWALPLPSEQSSGTAAELLSRANRIAAVYSELNFRGRVILQAVGSQPEENFRISQVPLRRDHLSIETCTQFVCSISRSRHQTAPLQRKV